MHLSLKPRYSKKRVLKAIRGSIEKWQKIIRGEGVDYGVENCPLCDLFYQEGSCPDCPVNHDGNHPDCQATPYYRFRLESYRLAAGGLVIRNPRSENAAKEELEFLKGVLRRELGKNRNTQRRPIAASPKRQEDR